MTELCITCKYVREHTDQQQLSAGGRAVRTVTHLLCQFAAPIPQFFGNAATLWPEVQATDWCGSYKHDPTAYDASVLFSGDSGLQAVPRGNQKVAVTFAGSGRLSANGSVP